MGACPVAPLKRRLIEQAQIECGEHVLDLGAGTATLTVMIKQAHPGVDVTGLDADPKALSIGRAKAAAAGVAAAGGAAAAGGGAAACCAAALSVKAVKNAPDSNRLRGTDA